MNAKAQLLEAILEAPPERYAAIMHAAKGAGRARPVAAKVAAEALGVHVKTLGRYARQGILHPVKLSKRLHRFDMNEVEALLAGKAGTA